MVYAARAPTRAGLSRLGRCVSTASVSFPGGSARRRMGASSGPAPDPAAARGCKPPRPTRSRGRSPGLTVRALAGRSLDPGRGRLRGPNLRRLDRLHRRHPLPRPARRADPRLHVGARRAASACAAVRGDASGKRRRPDRRGGDPRARGARSSNATPANSRSPISVRATSSGCRSSSTPRSRTGRMLLLQPKDAYLLNALHLVEPELYPAPDSGSNVGLFDDPKSAPRPWERETREAWRAPIVSAADVSEKPGRVHPRRQPVGFERPARPGGDLRRRVSLLQQPRLRRRAGGRPRPAAGLGRAGWGST